jgi:hypothetical protein
MIETLNELHIKLDLSIDEIKDIYKAYWKFIRSKIEELPLKEDLDEETFNKLKTSFNIPNLGKLHCTYRTYKTLKGVDRRIKDAKH